MPRKKTLGRKTKLTSVPVGMGGLGSTGQVRGFRKGVKPGTRKPRAHVGPYLGHFSKK